MRSLFDVNVLIALLDADHADHGIARRYLREEMGAGWASCAITQNGFVRIVSQPRYPSPVAPSVAMERLRGATETSWHEFWPCATQLVDGSAIDAAVLHGHRQITDAYLLALCVANGGRLVTFDRSVPLTAVPGATRDHVVLLGGASGR